MPNQKSNIVFAIYPNSIGFGFVYMENARKIIDFGSVRVSPLSNGKIVERIKQSINYLRPSIIVLQDAEGMHSRTGKRVIKLIKRIIDFSKSENLEVVQYSRDQIRQVFEQFKAITKYEIANVLITEFKELESKLPKKRSLWTSEDRNMAIFDAISLAITWYYLN